MSPINFLRKKFTLEGVRAFRSALPRIASRGALDDGGMAQPFPH
jgi:hypothetical protein